MLKYNIGHQKPVANQIVMREIKPAPVAPAQVVFSFVLHRVLDLSYTKI